MEARIEDKYGRENGVVFLTGIEAIVRLLIDKQRRDSALLGDINQTFLSGYEGSPLGGLDLKVAECMHLLNERGRTVHQFGINEKTAASAMLGTQYAPSGDVDAFWYGKAHGAMWIPDEVWLANLAGSGRRGSMVLLCGEDHRSKSSVSPGTSDWVLRSSLVPIFYPSSIAEILSLGMHAVLLSRYLGLVTALKLVTPICDGASTVDVGRAATAPSLPDEAYRKAFSPIVMALGALPMQRELVERKLPLAEQYVRLNGINRIHDGDAGIDVGIIATGKSYTDVRQALKIMDVRLPVLQLAVSFPLDRKTVREFAASGLKTVIVVEEPGPFVEDGVKAALWGTGVEEVFGKWDEDGRPFIPAHGEVEPEELVRLLWPRLRSRAGGDGGKVERLERILERSYPDVPSVAPMLCGGCPYNSFRDLDEKPGGAIGCSSIRAMEAYDLGVLYIPTMGAGGSIYSGTAPFNANRHIYQYLGDGSYFHSGRGAVQSCVQAEVNITFLLLFNGAVALTGGQQPAGARSVEDVAQELLSLGVKEVGIVSEDTARYASRSQGDGVRVYGLERHAEALQHHKTLSGTTALILDKECATEIGRRRRREGLKTERFVLIHDEICEGCGDCYGKSEGCAALFNTDTEFGPKTQIRQTNCVQDELCLDGECPSFLTVKTSRGVGLRRRRPECPSELPEPREKASADGSYTIFAVGRGGTGVVTISHLLAHAAMADGLHVYLSNSTGLAQKGGPVEAPMVLSRRLQPAFNRLIPGAADLYLGFDLLRAAEPENLKFAAADRTVAAVSTARLPTASMNRDPERSFPDPDRLADLIDECSSKTDNLYLDTYWLAEQLFGDTLYANILLLGAAYQAGLIPVKPESIESALRLNGKAVETNIQAFRWGRLAVADATALERQVGAPRPDGEEAVAANRQRLESKPEQLALHDELLRSLSIDTEGRRQLSVRIAELCDYQSTAYAREYGEFVLDVWRAERGFPDRGWKLTRAVIVCLYKLMAYKDEYEIARLATGHSASARIRQLFDGPVRVYYNLDPPSLRWLGIGKIELGPWFRGIMTCLRCFRGLRGTWADPFGRTSCRRLERELVGWYRQVITEAIVGLDQNTYGVVVNIAESPDGIRGYEEVKVRSASQVRQKVEEQLGQLRSSAVVRI